MPAIHRAVATLRILGEELDPDEISGLLGHPPTNSVRKGESPAKRSGISRHVSKNGVWRLEATLTEPENLDAQIEELTSKLTSDLKIWCNLSTKYKVDLFCGWFMKETNEGVDISAHTLQALSSRNIALALDIYAPDSDA